MKNHITKLASLILFFVFIQSNVFSQDMDKWMGQIDAINKTITKAVLENDPQAMVQFYTDDAVSLPSYQPMIVGKAALEAHAKEDSKSPMKMTSFTLATKKVYKSGDFLVEAGVYTLKIIMPGEKGEVPDNGKYLTVYEIQPDGSLKIKADTWNTDNNPWAMMKDHDMKGHEHEKNEKMEKMKK